MRWYRYRDGKRTVCGALTGERLAPLDPALGDLDALARAGGLGAVQPGAPGPKLAEVEPLAPLVRPPKIWCIGLNYPDHARDLDAPPPTAPVGFMRPAESIIGPGEPVQLPRDSQRVTGEGELALVLGRTGSDFGPYEVATAVAAWTVAVDMTAEDILRENPRFLTRAKSFDTFLSLGPCLMTAGLPPPELTISTLKNGEPLRTARVKAMSFAPSYLLEFFSRNMTWRAGDILLTGTPGAVPIDDGDVIGAEVAGVGRLENPVRR